MPDVPEHWIEKVGALERNLELADFAAALSYVNAVGEAAEAENHHPDILIHGWNRVRLTLTTHDEGGLTDADYAMAASINSIRLPNGSDT